MGVGLVRRSVQASAVALGAAIALLPSPVDRADEPPPPVSRSLPRAFDPLAAHVLERMPSLKVDEAFQLASVVRRESESVGLDPVLVMAVIGVESGWEPTAVSQRGARGLMQLRRLALETEEHDAGVAPGDVHDPVHNVRMGVRYLARMVHLFDDVDLALVAYNAGPTRLSSYLNATDHVPESMRSYARRVRQEERRLRKEMMRAEAVVADAAG
jgi:soluble lytic murein transglycosylase-like protein